MSEIEVIGEAARNNIVVRIEYQKKNGDINTYFINPIEHRNDRLWGFDREAGHIKQFIIGSIISAEATDETFTTDFPIIF